MLRSAAQVEKLETNLLNTQINPHFLFNSLNWIYFLSIEGSKETPIAIVQLSGFVRYLLKDANADTVALERELDYIRNYVSLQKGKLGHTVAVHHSIAEY